MYQLAPNVFACTTGRNCMFLDLREDRYLSVPKERMDALAPQIYGWHLPCAVQDVHTSSSGDDEQLLEDMLEAGILRPYQCGNPFARAHAPSATRDFTSLGKPLSTPGIRSEWVGTLAALASADFALRHAPLWRIVRRISARAPQFSTAFPADRVTAACALTERFRAIRPWFPRDYLCLFDSLALTLFLRRRGICASWIFAVREDPFAAHCWVQYGDLVLNEHLDRTRVYTPIMTV